MINFTLLNILVLVVSILNAESRICSAPSLTPAKIFLQAARRNRTVARVAHNRHLLQRQEFENSLMSHAGLLFDLIVAQVYLFSARLVRFSRSNLRPDRHNNSPPRLLLCRSFGRSHLQQSELYSTLQPARQALLNLSGSYTSIFLYI